MDWGKTMGWIVGGGALLAIGLGCGFSGAAEGEAESSEPPEEAPLTAEQEAQVTAQCEDECRRAHPDETRWWLVQACQGGCAARVRGQIRDGTWAPPEEPGDFDDCPGGSRCLNACLERCQGEHGAMVDRERLRACHRDHPTPPIPIPDEEPYPCLEEATNQRTSQCLRQCRSHPPAD